jgi:hypothetical protein
VGLLGLALAEHGDGAGLKVEGLAIRGDDLAAAQRQVVHPPRQGQVALAFGVVARSVAAASMAFQPARPGPRVSR